MKDLQNKLQTIFKLPFSWIILGCLCCFFSVCYQCLAQNKSNHLQKMALHLKKKQEWMLFQKKLENNLLEQMKLADPDYFENQIENLSFLEPEIKRMQALSHSNPQNEIYSQRLDFLRGELNHLRFREQNFQVQGMFQETEMIQEHPVEVNREDLKRLLALLENQNIGEFKKGNNPPNLFIHSFELSRKSINSNQETYVINLKLLKTEMSHN